MAQRPFEHADPERIVCRFDVSSVFDENEDEGDEDDDGAGAVGDRPVTVGDGS